MELVALRMPADARRAADIAESPRCGTSQAAVRRSQPSDFHLEPVMLILAALGVMFAGFLLGRRSRPRGARVTWKEGAEV